MTRTATLPIALALVVAGALGAQAQEGAQTAERGKLRWQLAQGDTMHYGFTWNFQNKQGIAGQMDLQDATLKVTYTMTQTVQSLGEDGVAHLEASLTSVKAALEMKMMGMPSPPMAYDSQAPEEGNEMLRVIRHVVGKTFTFKLAPNGAVSEVAGGQAIRDAVAKAAEEELANAGQGMGGPGGMGGMGMGGAQMGKMLAGQLTIAFADESLRSTLNVVNHVLPESGNAAQDESWTHDVVENLPRVGSLSFTGKYTHAGSAEGNTRIIIRPEGELKLDRDKGDEGDSQNPFAEMERQMLAGMKIKSTSMEGTATFGSGHIVDCELTQEINSEGELPPMLKMQMGQQGADMKMSVMNRLTLRYEKQDAAPAAPAPAEEKQDEGETKEGSSF